jgi:RNA polymerase sigma-70 factor, ECF subfamily
MARMASPIGGAHDDEAPQARSRSADAVFIDRVRQSDPEAFEALFRAYHQSLYAFAFRYLQSSDEADDAVQTVFVRIWNLRADWHVAGSLTDYLHLAIRNACRDRLKHDIVATRWREKRTKELRADLRNCNDPDAEDAVIGTREIDATIERAIDELPNRRREVFRLRFSEGLSYEAIAQRLGVATKTVETQISRGLKHVRRALHGQATD